MQLLQDTFIIENLQILSEGATDNKMRVKGVFGRCNEKNNNGRIYPTAVLESQLNKIQPMISERRLCGELDHPQNDSVKLSNASHLITKLEMKGDELIGEAELLNTPAGLTAQALIKGGVKIGISSRGMGTLSEDAKGNKIVNEDFRLVTFDLVADPSTRGAYPALSESTESKFVRETIGKLEKERNFMTMLESKMRDAYAPVLEEARKKTKKARRDLPGNQEALDTDGDGKIEGSDLAALRARRSGAMDAVKEEGSWHKIADAIAEMCGPRHSKRKRAKKVQEGIEDTLGGDKKKGGGTDTAEAPKEGLAKTALRRSMARRADAKDTISKAKANVKAAKITARGEAKAKGAGERTTAKEQGKLDRLKAKQGAKTAAAQAKFGAKKAEAEEVGKQRAKAAKKNATADTAITTGEKLGAAAKKAGEAAKKAPGAIKKAAEKTTQAAEKFGERLGAAKVRGAQQQAAKRKMGREDKAKRDERLAAASKPKTGDRGDGAKTPVDKSKVGETNAPNRAKEASKPAAKDPKKDPVNPELRARAASLRSRGNAPKVNPNIAGPKGKLPEWAVWQQIGRVIAEALDLI